MSPSRRTVLRTCSLAVVGGLAGCGADSGNNETTTTTTGTPTETADDNPASGPPDGEDRQRASLQFQSEYDGEVTITVQLRLDGNRLVDESRTVSQGQGGLLSADVPTPGEYTVQARLDSGETASREWTPGEEYAGDLTAVVTEDGGVTFRETLTNPDCSTDDLPFAVPDAEETFSTGNAQIENESGDTRTVTLTLAHSGEEFFSCTQTVDASQTVTIGDVIATAGTYTVTVDVADGGRTVSEWRVPEGDNYPALLVSLREEGPLVGCGSGGDVSVTVENPTDTDRTATLSLRRDGETVDETALDVAAADSTETTLSTPIGDFYTLVVESDGREATADVTTCFCYATGSTTVTLAESDIGTESLTMVCG